MGFVLEESSTYQSVIQRGREEGQAQGLAEGIATGVALGLALGVSLGVAQRAVTEAGELLALHARKRFGPATNRADATLASITDVARLRRIAERALEATSWNDLIATP